MTTSEESTMEATPREARKPGGLQELGGLWWIPLIRGILLILFGLLMLVHPKATLISLIVFLGAYWLVGGVFDFIEGIVGHRGRSRTWLILGGIVGILAGFFVMGHPVMAGLITGTLWIYTVAFAAIVIGITHFFAGRESSWSWSSFFLGLLYVAFGLLVICNPLLTETMLVMLLPVWAIVTGCFGIGAAFMLRRLVRQA